MPDKPENPLNFWEELKRRRVIGVIPVYAAAAFALLELVDIIADPLGLPQGTIKLVLILLLIGLVITILFSWIYDITPAGVKKTKPSGEIDEKAKPAESNIWKITTYVSVVIIVALVALNIIRGRKRADTISKSEKTIAVLPFHNLSMDSAQVYFCDGIREEILNHLHRVSPFTVRSRTSSDHYRNTEKTSSVIGEELNVNYLVEGSVGCEENQLKIWIQLIDAKNDRHLWSEDYIREKRQVFSIQSEIARKIAEELSVILSPDEIEKIESRPTDNLQAYQAYLRGRYYIGQPHFSLQNWNLALQNFQEAVEIDTGFALAYAELARSHARLYYLRHDLSESRLLRSDQAAAKALELGQDQPRVHLALGYYYLYAYRDHKSALKHLEIAEKDLPNAVEILIAKAAIFEPLGRWEEYITLLDKASEMSPRDPSIPTDLALGLWLMRRYREAVDACNRATAMDPELTWPYLYKAFAIWSWKGPDPESRDALENVQVEHEWYLWSWFYQEVGEGNYEAALQLMADEAVGWGVNHKLCAEPKTLFSAFIYDYLGKDKLAREGYETAVKLLEVKVREIPDDPRYHSALGIAYAGMGQKGDAIKEGKRAVKLLPMSLDAVYGIQPIIDLAVIYTKVGEPDLALEQFEYLLTVPSWMSTTWFDWDIRFAPLKTHPKYQELISKYQIGQ
jgi:TolB-like protein/Flp pilus assembly protein TadD